MELLEKELSWKYYGGKHYESIFTRFFQSYLLPQKFNIDKRKIHLSALINAGQVTRNEAINELVKETYPKDRIIEDIKYVIKKLGITENEFNNLMSLPPKDFNNYPNHYKHLSKLKYIIKIIDKNYEERP